MTWESQGPPQGQDPRWGGQPGPWQQAPPGYLPPAGPGYPPTGAPPPPGYPPALVATRHRLATRRPAGRTHRRPPGYPPSGPMWQPPPAYPLAPDAYPVNVSYDRAARINRLWGIPIVGWLVRSILLIPHFFILWLLIDLGAPADALDVDPGPAAGALPGLGLPLDRRAHRLVHPRAGLPGTADADLSAVLAER